MFYKNPSPISDYVYRLVSLCNAYGYCNDSAIRNSRNVSYLTIPPNLFQAIAAAFACDQKQYNVVLITHSAHEVCAGLLLKFLIYFHL